MVEGVKAPSDLAERLYFDQAADFSYMISAISLLGLSTIALLFLDFLPTPGATFRDTAMLAISLCYLALIARGQAWLQRTEPTGQDAKAYIADMERLLVLLGILWSVLLFVLMRHQNFGQLCLFMASMVGCLATPVLVSPVSCAFAFWTPISIGICIAMLVSASQFRARSRFSTSCPLLPSPDSASSTSIAG